MQKQSDAEHVYGASRITIPFSSPMNLEATRVTYERPTLFTRISIRPCLSMQASTTERTEAEEVASPCMAVTMLASFSACMEEAARSAAGREMSQPKIVAPWRAKRVAIVVPLPHPAGIL